MTSYGVLVLSLAGYLFAAVLGLLVELMRGWRQ